jgi:hypothetical protein
MPDSGPPIPARDARNQRGRVEIRVVLAFVVAVIVLGGLWAAIRGSPTENRRAVDSSNYETRVPIGPDKPPAQ